MSKAFRNIKGISFSNIVFIGLMIVQTNCGYSQVSHDFFETGSNREVPVIVSAPDKDELLQKMGLEYYLFMPDADTKIERYPLIYVYHGRNEFADETLSLWKKYAQKNGFMLLIPQRERPYEDKPADLEEFYLLLDKIISEYPVDPDHVYLAGVSAGGLIAKWLLMQNPKMWHGVIFIASPPFRNGDFRKIDFREYPPILYVHGWKDPQFDIVETVECVEELLKRGVKVQLYDYKHGVHEHNPRWNKRIFKWLELINASREGLRTED
ncbi:MAG: prolyl oligopeptidase family serine peptidase [Candidatus Omnitrophica bacterium]|nr:prolyl oligopeptidase family serine peptidase [Candidatus Omnitrophota bacterium]